MRNPILALAAALVILCLASSPLQAQTRIYRVQPGDTLHGIAIEHDTSLHELARLNGLAVDAWIYVGQRLVLPGAAAPSMPERKARWHVVRWGDTLWGIARQYGTTVESILRANGLESALIHAGQRLAVPDVGGVIRPRPQGQLYVVRWGDTLWGIARRHGLSVTAIMRANRLRSPRIFAGQRLILPFAPPPPAPLPTPMPTPVPHRLPEMMLSPWSGPSGGWVQVQIVGFPPSTRVELGIGPYGSELAPAGSLDTDATGAGTAWVQPMGEAGMRLVIAGTVPGREGRPDGYASALFRVSH